jgi:hypothetical protein
MNFRLRIFVSLLTILMISPLKGPRPQTKPKDSLADALGEMSDDMKRMRRIKQTHGASYDKPKPRYNEGMRGVKGEIYL